MNVKIEQGRLSNSNTFGGLIYKNDFNYRSNGSDHECSQVMSMVQIAERIKRDGIFDNRCKKGTI